MSSSRKKSSDHPSRTSRAPKATVYRATELQHTTRSACATPILKQWRHKTNTWPFSQHKLWLDISALPLHQLQEDRRVKNSIINGRSKSSGGPVVKVKQTSSKTNHCHSERIVTVGTLPSRMGSNTLVSYLRQHKKEHQITTESDNLLKLRTLARNPSNSSGTYRVGPLQLKRHHILPEVDCPNPPPDLRAVYHITNYYATNCSYKKNYK